MKDMNIVVGIIVGILSFVGGMIFGSSAISNAVMKDCDMIEKTRVNDRPYICYRIAEGEKK